MSDQPNTSNPDRKVDAKNPIPFKESWLCLMCFIRFNTHGAWATHLINSHVEGIEGPSYQCEQCQMKFRMYHEILTHYTKHTEKTYICNHCEKRFHYKINAIEHICVPEMRCIGCNKFITLCICWP